MLLRLSVLSHRGVRSSVSLTCTSRGRWSASSGRPSADAPPARRWLGGRRTAAVRGAWPGPSGTSPGAGWPRPRWRTGSLRRTGAAHRREAASPERSTRQAEREASKAAPETTTTTPPPPPSPRVGVIITIWRLVHDMFAGWGLSDQQLH